MFKRIHPKQLLALDCEICKTAIDQYDPWQPVWTSSSASRHRGRICWTCMMNHTDLEFAQLGICVIDDSADTVLWDAR